MVKPRPSLGHPRRVPAAHGQVPVSHGRVLDPTSAQQSPTLLRKLTKVARCRMPSLKVRVFYFYRAWAVLRSLPAQARPTGAAKNARLILTIFSHVSSLAVETNPWRQCWPRAGVRRRAPLGNEFTVIGVRRHRFGKCSYCISWRLLFPFRPAGAPHARHANGCSLCITCAPARSPGLMPSAPRAADVRMVSMHSCRFYSPNASSRAALLSRSSRDDFGEIPIWS